MDKIFIFGAEYLYILIIIAAVVFAFFEYRKKNLNIFKLTLVSLPLAFIIGKIADKLISNPRPFVVDNVEPLIKHSVSNGFPSDHTLLCMTVSLIVLQYNKKFGVGLIILSLIVGLSRVYVRVHHLVDILGSIVIAAFAVYVAMYFLKKYKLLK